MTHQSFIESENVALAETRVVAGEGRGMVIRTGTNTYAARITSVATVDDSPRPPATQIDMVGMAGSLYGWAFFLVFPTNLLLYLGHGEPFLAALLIAFGIFFAIVGSAEDLAVTYIAVSEACLALIHQRVPQTSLFMTGGDRSYDTLADVSVLLSDYSHPGGRHLTPTSILSIISTALY